MHCCAKFSILASWNHNQVPNASKSHQPKSLYARFRNEQSGSAYTLQRLDVQGKMAQQMRNIPGDEEYLRKGNRRVSLASDLSSTPWRGHHPLSVVTSFQILIPIFWCEQLCSRVERAPREVAYLKINGTAVGCTVLAECALHHVYVGSIVYHQSSSCRHIRQLENFAASLLHREARFSISSISAIVLKPLRK